MILPCVVGLELNARCRKEEVVSGRRIEIEHFIVIDAQTIDRAANRLLPKRRFRQITMRASKALPEKLKQ
jgi:hypothetical protein